uniref:HDC01527 n=1 Tax=Drosophila melanogaster TaxID=7227 RepID=Q6IHR2_DROME|nr:TPA_inf: HDC01527 [Drosophila melanogaster]
MTLLNRMGDSTPKHLQLTVQLQHPRHSLAACCAANLKSSRFPGTLNGASRCLAKFSDLFPSRSRWELALVRGHAESGTGMWNPWRTPWPNGHLSGIARLSGVWKFVTDQVANKIYLV